MYVGDHLHKVQGHTKINCLWEHMYSKNRPCTVMKTTKFRMVVVSGMEGCWNQRVVHRRYSTVSVNILFNI